MKQVKETEEEFKELSELNLFGELYKFLRESPGITITAAYLALILSSMAYLYVLFKTFDIDIIRYVTFEDILATPIKNPNIIVVFSVTIILLYLVDVTNRFRGRQQIKYANQKKPLGFKILQVVFWSPKNRETNIKTTVVITIFCIAAYIFFFAKNEAASIKDGQGSFVEITLADDKKVVTSTLLGTTSNYVLTYNIESEESFAYGVQSIKSIKILAAPIQTSENSEIAKPKTSPTVNKTPD